jgi:hypothetical protein
MEIQFICFKKTALTRQIMSLKADPDAALSSLNQGELPLAVLLFP